MIAVLGYQQNERADAGVCLTFPLPDAERLS